MVTFLPKLILAVALTSALLFGAVWLWQRQPKSKIAEPTNKSATQEAKKEEAAPKIIERPADNSVQTSQNVKFTGISSPNAYVTIYTGSYQHVIKTNQTGKFEKDLAISKGLNLINVAAFTADLKPDKNDNLTLYVAANTDNGQTVFAGSVKTIFDTVITIAGTKGDQNIKTSKSTDISGVKESKSSTAGAASLARVGDFIIALGDIKGTDSMDAKSVQIIRDNKPQNTESVIVAKTTSGVVQNLFSATNKDGAVMEFQINKNSDISVADKDARPPSTVAEGAVGQGLAKDITKDKTAFIFYHTESGKNISDLVYILP